MFAGYFDELVLDPLADWTAAALHGPPERADVEFTPVSLNLIQETKYSTLLDRPDIKLFARKGSRVGSYKIRADISPNIAEKNVKLLFQQGEFSYTLKLKKVGSSRLQIPKRLVEDIFQLKVIMMI